ncbi:endonuclease/exonuclease/phosphatase family protein [candidate division KSB1 bacterium]|nr:endonuclease/exonuclease/phosphatase family protein [candidate division KSB1 bacterium]
MTRVNIGSFNLRDFAMPYIEYYPGQKYDQKTFEKKIEWTAHQLKQMDCDVVGFQEIFHPDALEQAIQVMDTSADSQLVVEGATGEKPVVGLWTQFPVIRKESIVDFPYSALLHFEEGDFPLTSFSRPILKVMVEFPRQHQVVIFVAHLKSKRPDIREGADPHDFYERAFGKARSLIRRTAEAIAFRFLILDELTQSKTPVIVMGDLNDTGISVTTEIVGGSPPWKFLSLEKKKKIWDVLLYNVYDIQARQSSRDVYYTHIHNGHYEILDHILTSEEFYVHNRAHIGRIEYVKVLNDHLIDDTLSREQIPIWASDHGQVVATIKMK